MNRYLQLWNNRLFLILSNNLLNFEVFQVVVDCLEKYFGVVMFVELLGEAPLVVEACLGVREFEILLSNHSLEFDR